MLAFALHAVAAGADDDARWRLLLFDDEDCGYCARWEAEVGGTYGLTREGRVAPLSRSALADGVPDGVTLRAPVRYTPTFVLLDAAGNERGRITGYLGEDQFWGLLTVLIEREAIAE